MRVLITGLGGTLGPKVGRALEKRGATVLGWDRRAAPPDDAAAGREYLRTARPDAVVHLAMGSEDWAGRLAAFAREAKLPFAFTSTAMVFHELPDGPHRPGDERTARDDYGRYKIRCEDEISRANPDALIARIGWQIDPDGRGNNMLAHLDAWQRRDGRISASRAWIPACSFMEDTAEALGALLGTSGIVHLDSNAREAHAFDRVAAALGREFGRDWLVEPNGEPDAYRHDQRLVGHEDLIAPLSARLSALAS